jgi:molecular chaperone DnaJ
MRFQQGFFSIAKTCGKCNGHGQIITNPCPTCDGAGARRVKYTVNVKIPAGVDAGSRLKLRGEGEAGEHGGPSGDLYVVLDVEEHPIFQREGRDIVCDVPLSFAQAALGTEIEVPTLDGSAKVKVPAGTQSGQMFRIRGRGVPDLNGYGTGDELVRAVVETPRKLNAKQRELLEEFAKLSGEDVHPLSKSFFDKVKSMLG